MSRSPSPSPKEMDSVPERASAAKPTTSPNPSSLPRKVSNGTSPNGEIRDLRSFGRYELLMELGSGGMATLYLARIQGPKDFEKLLAIKKIHDHLASEQEFLDMFLDEARIAAKIDHPNVATIFDLGNVGRGYYIAMEYVHGQTLGDILLHTFHDPRRFPWTHAARIVADTASGLHAAHTLTNSQGKPLNVVHRDISPHNILISYEGHVKVVDFGIAFAAEKLCQTEVGVVKGKSSYMSPEQTEGGYVDHRSDIFSLGIVLFESVTLSRLFSGASDAATLLAVREAHIPSPRSRNPEIPEELEAIIYKALARDPAHRFQSVQEMADRINRLLQTTSCPVGALQLKELMTDLFVKTRQHKEEQITQAQQMSGRHVITSLRIEKPDTLTGPQPSPTGRRTGLWLLVGLAASALITSLAVLVLFLLSSKTTPDRPSSPQKPRQEPSSMAAGMPSAATASQEKPPKVAIRILVEPAVRNGTVRFMGKTYPGSDMRLEAARSERKELLVVEAPGYAPYKAEVSLASSSEIKVRLNRKLDVRVAGGRKARKKPRGSRRRTTVRIIDPF